MGFAILSISACRTAAQPQVNISEVDAVRLQQFSSRFQTHAMAIEPQLGESLAPQEAARTHEIEQHILNALKKDYVSGPMRRDVHARHHGCVKAQFKINNQQLPESLRQGIFARNAEYPTWIRFSNGSSNVSQPDTQGDIRGMAMKLMNVSGQKILPGHTAATQDFVMMNSREFFIEDLKDYVAFSESIAHGKWGLAKFAITHPRVSYRLYQIMGQTMASPLSSAFFSATAYKLGDQAIKFKVQPCKGQPNTTRPDNAGPHYLREAMSQHLQSEGACMTFMIQPRQGNMPVENATVEWPESISPYIPVARIEIPPQTFESPAQMAFCENLSFTPWHSLPEHRPLGVTNRVRKSVYELISQFRHEFNGVERREPTDFSF